MLPPLRFLSLALVALTAALGVEACGSTGNDAKTSATTAAAAATPAFARRVDIGHGRRMYLECRGSGSPTVILVSGLDIAADLWDMPGQRGPKVFPEIAKSTRVCAYDRPGAPTTTGRPSRSDPVGQPTSPKAAVGDLHALLTAARVPGPYVLVGHSYGGAVSRLYATTYPKDVSGTVSVDAFPANLYRQVLTAAQWKTWQVANARKPADIADYPPLERVGFDQTANEVQAGGKLPQIPSLVVLAADFKYGPHMKADAAEGKLAKGVPADFGYVIDGANAKSMAAIAGLVSGAKYVKVRSGHNIPIENAQAVDTAIGEVIAAVRAGRSTLVG